MLGFRSIIRIRDLFPNLLYFINASDLQQQHAIWLGLPGPLGGLCDSRHLVIGTVCAPPFLQLTIGWLADVQ